MGCGPSSAAGASAPGEVPADTIAKTGQDSEAFGVERVSATLAAHEGGCIHTPTCHSLGVHLRRDFWTRRMPGGGGRPGILWCVLAFHCGIQSLDHPACRCYTQANNGYLNYYEDRKQTACLASIDLSKVRPNAHFPGSSQPGVSFPRGELQRPLPLPPGHGREHS